MPSKGRAVTVVNHVFDDEVAWELFATDDELLGEDLRLVPLGTLLALDATLAAPR